MEGGVAGLSLEEEEEEELIIPRDVILPEIEDFKLCLVGFLLTSKSYNFPAFQSRMESLWRPGRRVAIEKYGDNLILFRFNHVIDLKRVLESGPWLFDESLLVLHELRPGEHPNHVDLCFADFWVRIYNLPPGFFSETVGKSLGNYIGSYIEFDENNMLSFDREYMRIKVKMDIRKSLKREKKLRVEGGECIKCTFRYEKLPSFCYICGKMGHIDRYCEVLFQIPEEQIVRMWDEELRAPPKKPKQLAGEQRLWRRDSQQYNYRRGGTWSTPRRLEGRWRAEEEVAELPPSVPRSVEGLMGNLGASSHTEGMKIAHGIQAVMDEDVALQSSTEAIDEYERCRTELINTLRREEQHWKQRAKHFWVKDGESNTRYFHQVASGRKKRKELNRLKDEGGNWQETREGMAE
ncbi:Uncharacterized protein At4g02000, partial [Linum perenne]